MKFKKTKKKKTASLTKTETELVCVKKKNPAYF